MTQAAELADFDYLLPPHLIAQAPAGTRRGSRLLHLDANSALHDRYFSDLPGLLRPGDLLVFNNTRVIKARLNGRKETGGQVEILIDQLSGSHRALAHVKASKSPKAGSRLLIDDQWPISVLGRQGELFELEFSEPVLAFLEQHGSTPLPPYITHQAQASDEERYQTVYAQHPGAVAAPTAGLHFDDAMLQQLSEMGIQQAFVTLHVGAGTFQPIRTDRISEHRMHAEHYAVPRRLLDQIATVRQQGGRVIAVGTTSVRALESAFAQDTTDGAHWATSDALEGDTRLFITPGYPFRAVDALLTNFHLPRSTLLMLVAALAGLQPIQHAYAHAVAQSYRFFSYGDAMFIEKPTQ